MSVRVSATEYAEKWGRRLSGSTEDIRKGIEKVTEAPTAKAAKKKDKMLQNLTASVHDGKWERGLLRVSLDDWKQAALNKGVGRIAAGVEGAKGKMEDFAGQVIPHIEAGQKKLENMPDVTLDDNINRCATFLRHMSQFKRK